MSHLKVYDPLGRIVAELVREEKEAGRYELDFNAVDLSSGVYFYKIEAGDFIQTKKMILASIILFGCVLLRYGIAETNCPKAGSSNPAWFLSTNEFISIIKESKMKTSNTLFSVFLLNAFLQFIFSSMDTGWAITRFRICQNFCS